MRSWTTFLVFGGIIIVLVLFWSFSRSSTEKIPVVHTSKQFLEAIKRNDADAVKGFLDPSMGKVATIGGTRIVNINFLETSSIVNSAFAKQDAVTWDYQGLTSLEIDVNVKPTVIESENLARVPLAFGRSIYLRRINNEWKVFFVTKGSGK